MEWTIPFIAFPAEAGTHLLTRDFGLDFVPRPEGLIEVFWVLKHPKIKFEKNFMQNSE